MSEHTNVVVILSDGTHRTMSAPAKVTFKEVASFFRQTCSLASTHMDGSASGVKPTWAFVALGREHMQYTGNEVEEIAGDARYMDLPPSAARLQNLTCKQIDQALRASGYMDNRLVRVQFVGMLDNGSARYRVAFDDCGYEIVGDVYVRLEADGERRADF